MRRKLTKVAAFFAILITCQALRTPAVGANQDCPSKGLDVVVSGDRAYINYEVQARLVSYEFKSGTFAYNNDFIPTYDQTLVDQSSGTGCLSVQLPCAGQIDAVTMDVEIPDQLTWDFAIKTILRGQVLDGEVIGDGPCQVENRTSLARTGITVVGLIAVAVVLFLVGSILYRRRTNRAV
jgi:hypothetical protein